MKTVWLFILLTALGKYACHGTTLASLEKVYLHFDQTGYFLKETMWFTAYVLNESNRPTDISKVLYVELLSPEGGAVATHKYKIKDGMCHGEFYLDSAYLSGFFEVRAYTRHMRNFGEDYYFTRVFPVFDIVAYGDYSIRSLYNRKRNLPQNETDWPGNSLFTTVESRRARKKALTKKQTMLPAPDSVRQIRKLVGRHNQTFRPTDIVLCNTPFLHPGSKVELMFRTTPNSRFSLSVSDSSSCIPTHYRKDICQSLFQDSTWVWKSLLAQQGTNAIRYTPERGIIVDGQIYSPSFTFFQKKRFYSGIQIRCTANDDSTRFKGEILTGNKGYWSFGFDDFYGEKIAWLSAPYIGPDDKEIRIGLHKWFSPQPRAYKPEETDLPAVYTAWASTDTLWNLATTVKQLQEVTVKAKRRKRYWKDLKLPLVHYSLAEEIDYLTDHEGFGSLSANTIDVATSIFHRYHYPHGGARWMILDRYEGDDSIPIGQAKECMEALPPDIKEVVIRTDYPTCLRYDYSTIGRHIRGRYGETCEWGYDSRDGYPQLCYVVCYVKYSPEELKSPARLRSYGLSPSNRITVVKGYTRPAVFSSPDYAQSRDRLQADFRRTLYWNPEVRADENGVARVTFYNNSTCHTLHISAEGIGGDGKPVIYKQK